MVKSLKNATASDMPAFSSEFLRVLKAVLFSYALTIPSFLIIAFIATYTMFPEKIISPAVSIISIISVIISGMISSRGRASKGWFYGAATGFIYFAVLYLISGIVYRNFSINNYVISMAAMIILGGTAGGIVGINSKTAKRRRHL